MIKDLRTFFKVCVTLSVGNEEIEESVVIVVTPGTAPTSVYHQISYSGARCDIGEGSIAIIPEKIIRSLSRRITPGINNVKIEIAVIVIVPPGSCAVIGNDAQARLIACR
jgi:hypothetical protein